MVKLKKAEVKKVICPTCNGNGFVSNVNMEDGENTYTNVGTVTRKENIMLRRKIILLVTLTMMTMMIFLSACGRYQYEGFDPTTATLRWLITNGEK